MAILGVDVGGTFTDAVLLDDGRVSTGKVLTAAHQEDSVVAAARAAGAGAVERFAHGTTVATNALLERKGARTAFVTNAGFEHLLHLRRQTRAQLYRPCADWPEPLVPLERCHGVRGRMGPQGELEPLGLTSLPELDADAVAVCLLHAYRDSAHEHALAAELRRRLPHARVVASHEVAPEFREYERASTTAADAYLGPVVARYLDALTAVCDAADLPEPLVMRSSGGVATPAEAAAHPATILVSGPAAGVVGAARIGALGGIDPAAVVEVVNAEMLRALRVVSVERGHDPADFALVAFGGAGPLHACELAAELGMRTVLVPEIAGVLSALGLVAADERRDSVRSYLLPLAQAGELPAGGGAELRYAGQSFELSVPLQHDLAEAFHRAHEAQYGFAERDREIELVAVRTAEVRGGPVFELPAAAPTGVTGPVVLELPGATCWIPPGWVGVRDGRMLRLTRS